MHLTSRENKWKLVDAFCQDGKVLPFLKQKTKNFFNVCSFLYFFVLSGILPAIRGNFEVILNLDFHTQQS